MIRFGIAGFGHHAVKRLMPGFAKAQRCRVTALSRRDLQRAQESARQFWHSIRLHLHRRALRLSRGRRRIRRLARCSCTWLTFLQAIHHRKPVLVEKPMAMNSAEASADGRGGAKRGRVAGRRAQHALRAQRAVVSRPGHGGSDWPAVAGSSRLRGAYAQQPAHLGAGSEARDRRPAGGYRSPLHRYIALHPRR